MLSSILRSFKINRIFINKMETLSSTKVDLIDAVNDNEPNSEAKRIKLDIDDNATAPQVEETPAAEVQNEQQKEVKVNKKRKYALCIGYSGTGYYGLQRNSTNKEFRTIEDEIVDGLVKINSIPQSHADEMFKMSFQRAARTDKGVSAAANLLSLKMELDENTLNNLNEVLPKHIRVFGYRKVTQGFDAKNSCDARTYMYLLPTYAFCPVEENTTEQYRASDERIAEVNEILKMYLGTHNYHNFTSGKKFIDPSAKRFIISMECGKPFIKDDVEFAVITVKGQSFMLHQIRKMIGMAIAVSRGIASKDSLEKCWSAYKIDMPMAPALGLMLERLHYEKYNRRFGKDGIHEPLIWTECEEAIEKLKQEHIYPTIIRKEINDKCMFNWLSKLCYHSYDQLFPNYPPGSYNGIGRAAYLLERLNGTDRKVKEEDENEGGDE